MARGYHTRKRSRGYTANARPFKKRRTARRRTGRKTSAFTSQSGGGGGLRFRARKTSRRAYNRLLWNSSLMLTHYRTIDAANSTINTPASQLSLSIVAVPAMRFTGGAFWVAAGGAVTPDAANALPTFTGDIILRGGMVGCRLANTLDSTAASQNSIQGTIMLIRTSKNYVVGSIPSTVDVGWDPTIIQDFNTKIGRIVYRKNFLLRDADVCAVEYRLKIRKIDETDYFNDLNSYVWIVLAGNVDNAIAHANTFTNYYNMSFTGMTQ